MAPPNRLPGPLGKDPSQGQDGGNDLLGGGFQPGPLGDETPLDAPPGGLDKGSKSKTVELNLVGSFPKPTSWTAKKEKDLIGAGTWFPHTLDFKGVAGTGSIEVTTAWDFLLKIIQAKASISRLNFFSHAKTGLVAIEGKVAEDGKSVSLAPSGGDGGWTQIISGKKGAICDPYAATWGSFGENSGSVQVTVDNTSFTLDDVRAKFAGDAVIWLYLCHGASDPNLHQNIANAFQVTVKAFTPEIVYCAPIDFPANRKHKTTPLTTAKQIDSCPKAVDDFHKLDTHSTVRTKTGEKPP